MDSHLTVIFVVISVLKHSYPLGVRIQASIEHYMLWDTNRAYIELISNCFCYYEYLLCRDRAAEWDFYRIRHTTGCQHQDIKKFMPNVYVETQIRLLNVVHFTRLKTTILDPDVNMILYFH